MTSIQILWLVLGGSWTLLEITIALKTRVPRSETYHSEKRIWLVVIVALMVALAFKQWHILKIPIAYFPRQIIALTLFALGLVLRFHAIVKLGDFFSTSVTLQAQHVLIEQKAYRWIRHPAYSGLLICFFAAGLAMGDFFAMVFLLCPITYVLKQRIRVEEQSLLEHFGQLYYDYSQRTKKLIPWIY